MTVNKIVIIQMSMINSSKPSDAYICVIGSDNNLSPLPHQAVNWKIVSIEISGIKFSETLMENLFFFQIYPKQKHHRDGTVDITNFLQGLSYKKTLATPLSSIRTFLYRIGRPFHYDSSPDFDWRQHYFELICIFKNWLRKASGI